MLLTLGLIPNATSVGYGDIRDRASIDGSAWLQPELKAFFNTKLMDQNRQLNPLQQHAVCVRDAAAALRTAPKRAVKKVASMLKKKK